MTEENPYEGTREALERVIRRLDVLEWIILIAAVGMALLGGALAAFLLKAGTGAPFRPAWVVFSILLLAVPGLLVLRRERRRDAEIETGEPSATDQTTPERKEDGGG